jgi:hypothetical protein
VKYISVSQHLNRAPTPLKAAGRILLTKLLTRQRPFPAIEFRFALSALDQKMNQDPVTFMTIVIM